MARKTRLNDQIRRELLNNSRQYIAKLFTKDEAKIKKAEAQLREFINGELRAAVPAQDVKVLEKYNFVKVPSTFHLSYESAKVEWHFRLEGVTEYALHNGSCPEIRLSRKMLTVYHELKGLNEKLKENVEARMSDYRALINNSLYLEDVAEIWSAASELIPKFQKTTNQALSILNRDVVERIQADELVLRKSA